MLLFALCNFFGDRCTLGSDRSSVTWMLLFRIFVISRFLGSDSFLISYHEGTPGSISKSAFLRGYVSSHSYDFCDFQYLVVVEFDQRGHLRRRRNEQRTRSILRSKALHILQENAFLRPIDNVHRPLESHLLSSYERNPVLFH